MKLAPVAVDRERNPAPAQRPVQPVRAAAKSLPRADFSRSHKPVRVVVEPDRGSSVRAVTAAVTAGGKRGRALSLRFRPESMTAPVCALLAMVRPASEEVQRVIFTW